MKQSLTTKGDELKYSEALEAVKLQGQINKNSTEDESDSGLHAKDNYPKQIIYCTYCNRKNLNLILTRKLTTLINSQ